MEINYKDRKSIIKPKRRAASSSLEKEIDLGGKYSYPDMLKAGLESSTYVNQSLLEEFKIQADVKMYF